MDAIGILGETTDATVGTHTAYTVPANKAARGRLQYLMQANGGGATTMQLLINNIVVFSKSVSSGNYAWSAKDKIHSAGAALPDGSADAQICCPTPTDFYLSAGDTVQVVYGSNAPQSSRVMFVGAEVDIS